jgi:hypothetical protein
VHHNFVARYEDWHWSSFLDFKFGRDGFIVQSEILQAFNGLENIMEFHLNRPAGEDWDY